MDTCSLPPATGPCRGAIPAYYYDSSSGTCQQFTYGGCQGNENKFSTVRDCLRRCSPQSKCVRVVLYGSLSPRLSPQNQGKELDLVTFTRKAVDFRCLNLAVPTRLQSKTTSTCDCFVAIYLCCCANTRIVDSEMNVQGQSTPQRFGSQGELSGFCL